MELDLNVHKDNVKDGSGTLYLLYIDIDDKEISKIGITSRDKPQKRWLEILESYWKHYRYMPFMYPKRYRKVDKVAERERELLDYLSEYAYIPNKAGVQGHTETVWLDRELVLQCYEMMIGDGMIMDEWAKCPVCGKDKKFSVLVDDKEVKTCGHYCEIDKDKVEYVGSKKKSKE